MVLMGHLQVFCFHFQMCEVCCGANCFLAVVYFPPNLISSLNPFPTFLLSFPFPLFACPSPSQFPHLSTPILGSVISRLPFSVGRS